MMPENNPTARIGGPIPDLPERRLLIVRELGDFSTDGTVHWTPELVETFMRWSDFGTDAPGVYRLAFVSPTITTEQVRGNDDRFAETLEAWNATLPRERWLKLIIQYGNTAASYLDGRLRCDGTDKVGIIEFFTSEFFERVSGTYALDRKLGGWHTVLDRSLKGYHISIRNWTPKSGYPDGWLENGYVHQGEPYGYVVLLNRTADGDLAHKCLPVSRALSEAAE